MASREAEEPDGYEQVAAAGDGPRLVERRGARSAAAAALDQRAVGLRPPALAPPHLPAAPLSQGGDSRRTTQTSSASPASKRACPRPRPSASKAIGSTAVGSAVSPAARRSWPRPPRPCSRTRAPSPGRAGSPRGRSALGTRTTRRRRERAGAPPGNSRCEQVIGPDVDGCRTTSRAGRPGTPPPAPGRSKLQV